MSRFAQKSHVSKPHPYDSGDGGPGPEEIFLGIPSNIKVGTEKLCLPPLPHGDGVMDGCQLSKEVIFRN